VDNGEQFLYGAMHHWEYNTVARVGTRHAYMPTPNGEFRCRIGFAGTKDRLSGRNSRRARFHTMWFMDVFKRQQNDSEERDS